MAGEGREVGGEENCPIVLVALYYINIYTYE